MPTHIGGIDLNTVLVVLCGVLPAYLLGGLNGAIIASKLFYRKDIREFGSGNPGLTNFYRVFGKGGALLVIAIDMAKAIAAVLFAGWLFGTYLNMLILGRALAGLFVILGHCFPLFYKFKGGKGIMSAATVLIVLDWRVALICYAAFFTILAIFRYVSLASIVGSMIFPPSVFFLDIGGDNVFIIATLCAVLLVVRHKGNIKRLVRREEPKFSLRREL